MPGRTDQILPQSVCLQITVDREHKQARKAVFRTCNKTVTIRLDRQKGLEHKRQLSRQLDYRANYFGPYKPNQEPNFVNRRTLNYVHNYVPNCMGVYVSVKLKHKRPPNYVHSDVANYVPSYAANYVADYAASWRGT